MSWPTARLPRSAALVLAVCLSFGAGTGARAATTSVPASVFIGRIDQAISLAQEGQRTPSIGRMNDVRATLGLPLVLELPGGHVRIPRDRVLESLTGTTTGGFKQAEDRLRALRTGLAAALNATPFEPSRAAVADALRGTQTNPTFLQRAREIWDGLLGLIGRGFSVAASTGWGAILFIVVGGLLVLFLIVFSVRRIRVVQDRSVRARKPTEHEDPAKELEQALARGDLAAAVRAQFRLLVHALAAEGIVLEGPALTAGECRAAVVSARRTVYPVVERATDAFERVAYGDVVARGEHLDVLRRATQAVRAA